MVIAESVACQSEVFRLETECVGGVTLVAFGNGVAGRTCNARPLEVREDLVEGCRVTVLGAQEGRVGESTTGRMLLHGLCIDRVAGLKKHGGGFVDILLVTSSQRWSPSKTLLNRPRRECSRGRVRGEEVGDIASKQAESASDVVAWIIARQSEVFTEPLTYGRKFREAEEERIAVACIAEVVEAAIRRIDLGGRGEGVAQESGGVGACTTRGVGVVGLVGDDRKGRGRRRP